MTDRWRDIETAPMDRTPVLGYFGDTAGDDLCDIAVVHFNARAGQWVVTEDPDQTVDDPTHWQPLPSPPATAEEDRS